MTLVLVFISSYCAFGARNVYVHASHSPSQLWLGYWTDTKRRCKLRNKLSSFHPCIHASLPFLLVSVWLGAINKELHRHARTCYFSVWRRCLQICLLAYPQYATLHKFASRLVSQKNICVLHYRNEFFYFQENSFDIFLPYTAYCEDSAIHRHQNTIQIQRYNEPLHHHSNVTEYPNWSAVRCGHRTLQHICCTKYRRDKTLSTLLRVSTPRYLFPNSDFRPKIEARFFVRMREWSGMEEQAKCSKQNRTVADKNIDFHWFPL